LDEFSIPIIQIHQKFMAQALLLAEEAASKGEVPVGAVITYQNRVIAKAYNQVEMLNDPTAHAEILAITSACSFLDQKYLKDCTLYVTLEPCPMCAGALVWSKIDRVVFGASDPKAGACGTLFNLHQNDALNHEFEVIQGILEQDCEYLLKDFFRKKR
jgi:tRNA(adenine34) deaminase